MAYHVEIDEGRPALAYLLDPDRNLSGQDTETILNFLERELGQTGDVYRNEPDRRCPPGSPNIEITLLFKDSAGQMRQFRFIISDAAAQYGVLRVRFAEELR
jgi:hypothetical protein